jgi:amino-acid N-acetyltransferase
MRPFVRRGDLIARSAEELVGLLGKALVAESDGRIAGFAALEIYSAKMSEIQGLAFPETDRGRQIARQVVEACVARARAARTLEVMAIVPKTLEGLFKSCGFGFSLPRQKRALFIRPAAADPAEEPRDSAQCGDGVTIRRATPEDLPRVSRFVEPFVRAGQLLPRTEKELAGLLRYACLAESQGRIVGFAALEIYSRKLAEIQCLSVDLRFRRKGVGRRLVQRCVEQARTHRVAETMAISSRARFLLSCGFDYSLPGPKTALFLRTR